LSLTDVLSPFPPAGEGRSKKRKRGGSGPSGGLSVPVICTANDAYAPCLRPLRDIAAVYHFKPPVADKLAARLGAIAAAEGLGLDKQVCVCVEARGLGRAGDRPWGAGRHRERQGVAAGQSHSCGSWAPATAAGCCGSFRLQTPSQTRSMLPANCCTRLLCAGIVSTGGAQRL
jgi:hypothetical protein